MIRNSRTIPIAILIIVYVVTYRQILSTPYLIVGVDFPIPSKNIDIYLYGLTSTWSPFNMGSPSVWSYGSLFIAFISLISGMNPLIAQKMLFIHPLASSLSMYYFISKYISRNPAIALVGSVIYAYGPPTSYNYGWIFFGWNQFIIPLLFSSLLSLIRNGLLKNMIMFSILLSISISLNLHYAIPILLSTFLLVLLSLRSFWSLRILLLYISSLPLALIINPSITIVLLSLLGFKPVESIYFTPRMIEFMLNYSGFTMVNAFTSCSFIPLSMFKPLGFIFPIFAFSSLIMVRDKALKSLILSLSLTYILLVFFCLNVVYESPIFKWLFHNFPPLRALRGIHGPSFLVWILISMLIPLTLSRISRYKHILCLILIVSFYIYEPVYITQSLTSFANLGVNIPENPKVYGEIIDWLRENCNGRYFAVPYIHTAWLNLPSYPYMFMPVGLGSSRYVYGYVAFTSSMFIHNLTDNLSSMLRPANVKHILLLKIKEPIPSSLNVGDVRTTNQYLTQGLIAGNIVDIEEILESQKNIKPIVLRDEYTIYENNFSPLQVSIYTSTTYAVGNRYIISKTSNIPCINNTLIFLSEQSSGVRYHIFNKSSIVLFYNRDIYDLAMQYIDTIDLMPYGGDERLNIAKEWIKATEIENRFLTPDLPWMSILPWYGDFHYGEGFIETISNSTLTLTLQSPGSSVCEVWLRVLLSPYSRASINISINGEDVGSISPRTQGFIGFKWLRVGRLTLDKEMLNLKISKSDGYAAIDDIAIIPEEVLNRTLSMLLNMLSGKDIILIYDEPLKIHIPLTREYHILPSRNVRIDGIGEIKPVDAGKPIRLEYGVYNVEDRGGLEIIISTINPALKSRVDVNYSFRRL
ncbi:MAG: hypothetical protein QXR05_11830, partial [Candidatus Methanomethylicia archaeon]